MCGLWLMVYCLWLVCGLGCVIQPHSTIKQPTTSRQQLIIHLPTTNRPTPKTQKTDSNYCGWLPSVWGWWVVGWWFVGCRCVVKVSYVVCVWRTDHKPPANQPLPTNQLPTNHKLSSTCHPPKSHITQHRLL